MDKDRVDRAKRKIDSFPDTVGKIEFMGVPIDNLPHAALIKLCKHLAAKELDRRTEAFCDARNYA